MGENNISLRETHIVGKNTREQIVSREDCPPLSLHGIWMTGLSQTVDPFIFVRRQPRLLQALVCISGTGLVWIDGVWTSCDAGSVYLTPPGAPHGYRAIPGFGWEIVWVIYGNPLGRQASHAEHPALFAADPHPLTLSVKGLYRESLGPAEPALMHSWAHLVHASAQRILEAGSSPSTDTRLRSVWGTVDARLAHPWSVDQLAEQAGTSGEHLRRLCREQLGRSPMRHVAYLRMRRATALLTSEAYTIEAVAAQVGYENAFAFSTAFKRHLGLSPSEYRGQKRAHQVAE